jgi:hypothetical protein
MLPLIRRFVVAFFTDELAFRRWLRGLVSAAVPISLQLLMDEKWPTWTVKEWMVRAIPSAIAFVHGAMQSSAKAKEEKRGAKLKAAP